MATLYHRCARYGMLLLRRSCSCDNPRPSGMPRRPDRVAIVCVAIVLGFAALALPGSDRLVNVVGFSFVGVVMIPALGMLSLGRHASSASKRASLIPPVLASHS